MMSTGKGAKEGRRCPQSMHRRRDPLAPGRGWPIAFPRRPPWTIATRRREETKNPTFSSFLNSFLPRFALCRDPKRFAACPIGMLVASQRRWLLPSDELISPSPSPLLHLRPFDDANPSWCNRKRSVRQTTTAMKDWAFPRWRTSAS